MEKNLNKQMNPNIKYMVHVECMTFNHAPYIVDTMNGFVKQKTSFPFICTIIDDASSDGEVAVIDSYLKECFLMNDSDSFVEETDNYRLLFSRHKENVNCYFVVIFLKYNHYSIQRDKQPYLAIWRGQSKYTAFCEGDDYWKDENKLQKQVDCLEKHPNSVLCYTSFESIDEHGNITHNRYRPLVCYSGYVFEELLKSNFVQTVTVMCRVDMCEKAVELTRMRNTKYDYAFFLELALMGDFEYIDEITSVYRICQESASHSKSLNKEIKFAFETQSIKWVYEELRNHNISLLKKYCLRIKLALVVTIKHYIRNILSFKH